MRIIVEGPNGVGKTQFINQLLAIPAFENFHVEHQTKYGPNNLKYYTGCLVPTSQNIIYDRFAASEIIYSDLEGRTSNLSISEYEQLVKHTNEVLDDAIWIFIDADYDMIYRAYESRNEVPDYDYINDEKRWFRHFVELTKLHSCNVLEVKVHYNDEYNEQYSVHNVLNKLKEIANGI